MTAGTWVPVRNDDGQFSVWPQERTVPLGWQVVGVARVPETG